MNVITKKSLSEKAMLVALDEAKRGNESGEVPVGAVIVSEETVVARAHNEREGLNDPTAHAEMLAIRRAAKITRKRRLSGCTLYVTLEPCAMCAGAALAAGLDMVVFGAYDDQRGCAGSIYCLPEDSILGGKIPCVGGVMEAECQELIKHFFREKR